MKIASYELQVAVPGTPGDCTEKCAAALKNPKITHIRAPVGVN